MKFDIVCGNPPFDQRNLTGDSEQNNYYPPVYHYFMDQAIKVADKVLLIHPGKFLFNAGGTPKTWNKEKLNDPHFKVLKYIQDSQSVFPSVIIKGGVAITYYDNSSVFTPIGAFTPYQELNSIKSKVWAKGGTALNSIIFNRGLYRFSPKCYSKQSEIMSRISDARVGASSFYRLNELFTEEKPDDPTNHALLYGLDENKKRTKRWIKKEYLNIPDSFYKFKVLVPSANGSGKFGETLSSPIVGERELGHTETFLTVGSFETCSEANACLKYIKTKFARSLLGILKSTQHNSPEKWKMVPIQDFTENSDIDWSKSIPEIDQQLYKKYGLSEEEINFIEEKVQAME